MKFTILSALLGLSFTASATTGPLDDLDKLPWLTGAQVEIEFFNSMLATQPTGHVKFGYTGCKKRQYKVEEAQAGKVTLLKIIRTDKPGIDCMAEIQHTERIQISSDMDPSQRYVILNPVLPVRVK